MNDHPSIARLGPTPEPEGGDFDALADLFLGGSRYGPAEGTNGRPAQSREERVLATHGSERAPQPVRGGAIAPGSPNQGDEMTLPVTAAQVEAIALGHLPVRAGIWVKQYATGVAASTGGVVGLVRCAGGTTTIELIGPRERLHGLVFNEELSTHDSISRARRLVDHWIVRVSETDEPAIGEHPGVARLTVLSGADEAAVVASYRLLKSVVGRWDAAGDEQRPSLSVAVMGSGPDAAREAGEKIARAASAFLEYPLDIAPGAARVDAGIGGSAGVLVHRSASTLDTDELLALLAGNSHKRNESAPALRLAAEEADYSDHGSTFEPHAALELQDTCPPKDGPEIVVRSSSKAHREASGAGCGFAPARTPAAGLIGGLTLLETRCPAAPGVELATDHTGDLHLVADGLIAIAQLTAAKTWAGDHVAILHKAEPSVGATPRVFSHVVVDTFAGAGPIASSGIRVHLSREVETPAGRGFVAVELDA